MIKQILTPDKAIKVKFSLQKMAILSQMLLLENQTELDADFRVPFINNFAKRIGQDCEAIQLHLRKSGRMVVNISDKNFSEDYSGEIWRVVNLLSGLDIELIREFANNLEKEFEELSS